MVIYLLWFAAAAWVFVDSRKRTQDPVMWTLGAVVLPVLAVPAYYWMVVKAPKRPMIPPRPPAAGPVRRAGSTGQLKHQEPGELESMDDLKALYLVATAAMNENKPEEAMRLMGRIFLEAALGDVTVIASIMGQAWLNELNVGPASKPVLQGILEEAIAAAGNDDFRRAFELLMGATQRAGAPAKQPIPGILLLAGFRAAADARQRQAVEDRFDRLVAEATELMLTTEGRGKAQQLFQQALALVPDPPLTPRDEARRERVGIALQSVVAMNAPAGTVKEWIERAYEVLETDTSHALQLFADIAARAPDHPGGWVGQGDILRATGRHAEAVPCYERALKIAPRFEGVWFAHADSLECLDRLDEALASYDEALKLEPQMVNAWVDRAHVLHRLRRNPEALESLKKAHSIHPDHAVGWFNRAEQELIAGLTADAVHSYGQFLSLVMPGQQEKLQERARRHRALLLHQVGRFDEAVKALDELGSQDAHLLWARGSCLLALGKAEAALEVLARVPDEHPDVWIDRGLCLERLKRVPEALEAYGHGHALSGRRWVHEARLRPERAQEYYGRAVEALLAEDRGRRLDHMRTAELAYARKKLAELDPEHLAELEAFDAERRAAKAAG